MVYLDSLFTATSKGLTQLVFPNDTLLRVVSKCFNKILLTFVCWAAFMPANRKFPNISCYIWLSKDIFLLLTYPMLQMMLLEPNFV